MEAVALDPASFGELEQGFVDRIANTFPHAMDEVIIRLSRHRLKRLS